jgi:poly-gamma-glutamate synthesis protein (capsule biosynthesis protein)
LAFSSIAGAVLIFSIYGRPVKSAGGEAGESSESSGSITLFLGGDVMTGRGIDQILPHPSDPAIHEPYAMSAKDYVAIAERSVGPIPASVELSYIWGDALAEWERAEPDIRIVNLETSVTTSDEYWKDKSIHYRMHPDNVGCLTAANIDFCSLANNHILDWGYPGLADTAKNLSMANISFAGAGSNIHRAQAPAILPIEGKGRLLIFSFGSVTSGIPSGWAATEERAGVNVLPDLSESTVGRIGEEVRKVRQKSDVVVASIHWGDNWGYEVPDEQRAFAHRLIDRAGVDVIHGHSSHHARPIEVYRGRPVIYGCGDFINDYEGISGYESFRNDLVLMYLLKVDPSTGGLLSLEMVPFQIGRFRLNRASQADALWLKNTLDRECAPFGTGATLTDDHTLVLEWH